MSNPETNTPSPTPSILLVYEEVPERTVILLLNDRDLVLAKLSYEEIASIHGTLANTVVLSEGQREIHDNIWEAIFEEGEQLPAPWESKKIYDSGAEHLSQEGLPPKIDPGDVVVICAGFVL